MAQIPHKYLGGTYMSHGCRILMACGLIAVSTALSAKVFATDGEYCTDAIEMTGVSGSFTGNFGDYVSDLFMNCQTLQEADRASMLRAMLLD